MLLAGLRFRLGRRHRAFLQLIQNHFGSSMAFVGKLGRFIDQRLELRAQFLRLLNGGVLTTPDGIEIRSLEGKMQRLKAKPDYQSEQGKDERQLCAAFCRYHYRL